MKKRVLSLLMVMCLLLGVIPFGISASALRMYEEYEYGDYLRYKLIAGGVITITDCSSTATGKIVGPACIEGYPVTVIDNNALEQCDKITEVVISDGVKEIDAYAFLNCDRLKSVSIPESVTLIGSSAFAGCKALNGVVLPSKITSISSSAFQLCESLKSITIPEGVTSIGARAFAGCKALTKVSIPESVKKIEASAFANCIALESVKLPEGLTEIGNRAFASCNSLTKVTLPGSLTTIGDSSFENCANLKRVVISEGTETIDKFSFAGCGKLVSVTIPASVTTVKNAFINCYNLPCIVIPKTVTSIVMNFAHADIAYCEAESKPGGWDSSWKNYIGKVYWGCSPEAVKPLAEAMAETKGLEEEAYTAESWAAFQENFKVVYEEVKNFDPSDKTQDEIDAMAEKLLDTTSVLVAKRRMGDVNNDGNVDKKDFATLKRYCLKLTELDENSLAAANVNGDDAVDKKDFAMLKRVCLGMATITPEFVG